MRMACAAALVALTTAATASELDFSYQGGMPTVLGTLERSVAAHDEPNGLYVVKQVFDLHKQGYALRTHVAEIACGDAAAPRRPYIVAMQILPRQPASFAAATLIDGFVEVYVEDDAGRVRLYRNVSGYVMAQLTDRFRPACPAI